RSMWLNSTQREEPYQGLTYTGKHQRWCPPCGRCTGGAWLSSARVVRCWVKSRNERNPCPVLPASPSGCWGLTGDRRGQLGGRWGRRQVIMPLMSWAAHVLQWPVQRDAIPRGGAQHQKTNSDRNGDGNPPLRSRRRPQYDVTNSAGIP